MATLSPNPNLQFLDASGDPYVDGKLFTYSAGTATKKATYKDNAQDASHPNPIILDSRGSIPDGGMWLGTGSYKLELYPSTETNDPPTGTAVWSVDNIDGLSTAISSTPTMAALRDLDGGAFTMVQVLGYYAENDGGEGLFYWDSSSTQTDDNGTIIIPDAGGTGRWKRLYENSVNLRWFGAKGDNSTDDGTALTDAETALSAVGGGDLIVTQGTYLLGTATYTLNSDVTLVMRQGAQFNSSALVTLTVHKLEATLDQHFPSDDTNFVLDIEIDAVALIYPDWWGASPVLAATDQTLAIQSAINAAALNDRRATVQFRGGEYYADNLVMTNKPCTFRGDSNRGTILKLFTDSDSVGVANLIKIVNLTEKNGYVFIDMNFGTNGFTAASNPSTKSTGIDATLMVLSSFTRCNFGNFDVAMRMNTDSTTTTFTDCIFGSNNNWGIRFESAGTDLNCRVIGCWFDENLAGGLYCNSDNVIISGNNFQDNTGVHIQLDASSTTCIVSNNILYEGSSPGTANALTIGGDNNIFTGNLFKTFTDVGDVVISAGASGNQFINNFMDSDLFTDGGTNTAICFANAGNFAFGREFTDPDYRVDVDGDVRIQGSGSLRFGATDGTADCQISRDSANVIGTEDSLKITSNVASSSSTTGSLIVTGGVGVSEDLYVAANVHSDELLAGDGDEVRIEADSGNGVITLSNDSDSIVTSFRNQIGQGAVINVSEAGSLFVIEINGVTDRYSFSETELTLNSADLTLNSADLDIATAGKGLKIASGTSGSNTKMGTGVIPGGGTQTVATTAVSTGDIIFLSSTNSANGMYADNIVDGVSFDVTGTSADSFNWLIITPS
jgi:hypothetical protein